ncbi:MAG: hypothetical protein VB071_05810 [Lawsonibacter sp.]|nr:hypothetical protein [Lawsonibacter sp.]
MNKLLRLKVIIADYAELCKKKFISIHDNKKISGGFVSPFVNFIASLRIDPFFSREASFNSFFPLFSFIFGISSLIDTLEKVG